MPQVVRMQPNRTFQLNNTSGGNGYGNGGIQVCCCRMCTCVHLGFITSKHGVAKLFEVVLGSFCQTLLIKFGLSAASDMGQAFNSFLTTASSCLMTSGILMGCYVVSSNSFNLIRQSLFEVIFNTIACFMYFSAASYMGFAVNIWLYPRFVITPAYMAYPAMTGVYYMGYILGIIYMIDAYMSYQYYKGKR